MSGYLKRLVLLIALILSLLFVLFVINQTAQVVNLASTVSPAFGQVVLFLLLAVYALMIVVPLIWLGRMPRALLPPARAEGESYDQYIRSLGKRLAKNPYLEKTEINLEDLSTIESGLQELNEKADARIKSAASNVFIMTAISQYGALDALIVLLAQLRMVWQVTTLYYQRPALKELVYLYSNVFATAFLASRIENMDLLEDQLEPVIASIMGSSLSSLTPAFNTAASIVTSSIIEGSANAFLTLRVGVITKTYCSSLIRQEKKQLRRTAAVQAASMLGKVLSESAYTVTKVVFKAASRASARPFRYGQELVTKTTKNTWDASKTAGKDFVSGVRKTGKKFKLFGKREEEL